MVSYYPPTFDMAQVVRRYTGLDDIECKRERSKGAPEKAKSAGVCVQSRCVFRSNICCKGRAELARSGDTSSSNPYLHLHVILPLLTTTHSS